jgi:hypothetical protein
MGNTANTQRETTVYRRVPIEDPDDPNIRVTSRLNSRSEGLRRRTVQKETQEETWKETELKPLQPAPILVHKKGDLVYHGPFTNFTGEGHVTKDGKKVSEGTYQEGKLICGKKRGPGPNDRWAWGDFVEEKLEGEVTDDEEGKELRNEGTYHGGKLVTGKYKHRDQWYHGDFKEACLYGPGRVTDDYEGKKISREGVFEKDKLVEGKRYSDGKWYHGKFVDEKLTGDGKITTDYEGKKISREGIFEKDKLVEGKMLHAKKWYHGKFVDDKLTGDGKITTDYEGEDILQEGVFVKDTLTEGRKLVDGKWRTGHLYELKYGGTMSICEIEGNEKKGLYKKDKFIHPFSLEARIICSAKISSIPTILVEEGGERHIFVKDVHYLTLNKNSFAIEHPISYADLALVILLSDECAFSMNKIEDYVKYIKQMIKGTFAFYNCEDVSYFKDTMKVMPRIRTAINEGSIIVKE